MKKVFSVVFMMVFAFSLFSVPSGAQASPTLVTDQNPAWDHVGLYEVYEITYVISENIPATNVEKSALDFHALFTGPTGVQINLPGFWAGGNIWKLRFAPNRLGIWDWVTISPNPNLDGLTGSVVSVPSKNKGFVQVSQKNPYTFQYSDGTPYYMWGNTGYLLLMQALEGPGVTFEYTNPENPAVTHTIVTGDWHEFVDKTQQYGMNKIRFLVTMWNWGYDFGHRWYPWEDCTVEHPRFDSFNQAYWEKLDEVVQYMKEKGMVAELIMFADYADWAPDDPGMHYMTLDDEKRFIKFAAARYGAYSNVIWSMANEHWYNFRARYGGRVPDAWAREVGTYMAEIDPYRTVEGRLLSVHNRTKMNFNFPNDPWPTHFVIQVGVRITPKATYAGHPSLWGNDSIRLNWGYNKPVVNDEYGYVDHVTLSTDGARQAAWGIAIGGGYGTYGEWNVDTSWDPDGLKPGGLLGHWNYDPSHEDIKVLTDFMQTLDYVSMSPNNALIVAKPANVKAYMLAEEGAQYLMYAAEGSGGTFTINIVKGIYDAEWIDPATGAVIAMEPRFHLKGVTPVNFQSPAYTSDIALKITSVSQ